MFLTNQTKNHRHIQRLPSLHRRINGVPSRAKHFAIIVEAFPTVHLRPFLLRRRHRHRHRRRLLRNPRTTRIVVVADVVPERTKNPTPPPPTTLINSDNNNAATVTGTMSPNTNRPGTWHWIARWSVPVRTDVSLPWHG